ncbi:hypothetical protein Ciccas_007225 [Cichlidogyrus casuarinus]|uniref:Uncharacterized protein n=1 Tax=Cichlidogyrus casuarinus TaxID=1844966 RepID=A0ABD2Q3I5_9PLAT
MLRKSSVYSTIFYDFPQYFHVNAQDHKDKLPDDLKNALSGVKEAAQHSLDLTSRPGLMELFKPFIILYKVGIQHIECGLWKEQLIDLPKKITGHVDAIKKMFKNETVSYILDKMYDALALACRYEVIEANLEETYNKGISVMSDFFDICHQIIRFPVNTPIPSAEIERKMKINTRYYSQRLIKSGKPADDKTVTINIKNNKITLDEPLDVKKHLDTELKYISSTENLCSLNCYLMREYLRQLAFLMLFDYHNNANNLNLAELVKDTFISTFESWCQWIPRPLFEDLFQNIPDGQNLTENFDKIYIIIENIIYLANFGIHIHFESSFSEYACNISIKYMEKEMIIKLDFKDGASEKLTYSNNVPYLSHVIPDFTDLEKVKFFNWMFFAMFAYHIRIGIWFPLFEHLLCSYNALKLYEASLSDDEESVETYKSLDFIHDYIYPLFKGSSMGPEFAIYVSRIKNGLKNGKTNGLAGMFNLTRNVFVQIRGDNYQTGLLNTGKNIIIRMREDNIISGITKGNQVFTINWKDNELSVLNMRDTRIDELLKLKNTFTDKMIILLFSRLLGKDKFEKYKPIILGEVAEDNKGQMQRMLYEQACEILKPPQGDNDRLLRCHAINFIKSLNLDSYYVYDTEPTRDQNPNKPPPENQKPPKQPEVQLPPSQEDQKTPNQEPKPVGQLLSTSLEIMNFSDVSLESLTYKLTFENNQTRTIEVKKGGDINGWYIVNTLDKTKLVNAAVVNYKNMVSDFIARNYDRLKKEQIYSVLTLYASLAYCAMRYGFSNVKILDNLPNVVSKHKNIYDKLTNMKFSSKSVDIFTAVLIIRAEAKHAKLNLEALSKYMYTVFREGKKEVRFEFGDKFVFLFEYKLKDRDLLTDNYVSDVRSVLTDIKNYVIQNEKQRTDLFAKLRLIAWGFEMMYRCLLSVRHLQDSVLEEDFRQNFTSLLEMIMQIDRVQAKSITDEYTAMSWKYSPEDTFTLVARRNILLGKIKRCLTLSTTNIYCKTDINMNQKIGTKTLDLYWAENCQVAIQDIVQFIEQELEKLKDALSRPFDLKKPFNNIALLLYLKYVNLDETRKSLLKQRFDSLISEFRSANRSSAMDYVYPALSNLSQWTFEKADIRTYLEPLIQYIQGEAEKILNTARTTHEKKPINPPPKSFKETLGPVEQVILQYRGETFFFAITPQNKVMQLNKSINDTEEGLLPMSLAEITNSRDRLIQLLNNASTFEDKAKIFEIIVLLERAATTFNSSNSSNALNFDPLWARMNESSRNILDPLKNDFKTLFSSRYQYLGRNQSGLSGRCVSILKKANDAAKERKIKPDPQQKRSAAVRPLSAFEIRLMIRNGTGGGGGGTLYGNRYRITRTHISGAFDIEDLNVSIGYVTQNRKKVPTVIKTIWDRKSVLNSKETMDVFDELCRLVEDNMIESNDSNLNGLFFDLCAALALKSEDLYERARWRTEVMLRCDLLVQKKSLLGSHCRVEYEKLQAKCGKIFAEETLTVQNYSSVIDRL